jgi:hypothetical protein
MEAKMKDFNDSDSPWLHAARAAPARRNPLQKAQDRPNSIGF